MAATPGTKEILGKTGRHHRCGLPLWSQTTLYSRGHPSYWFGGCGLLSQRHKDNHPTAAESPEPLEQSLDTALPGWRQWSSGRDTESGIQISSSAGHWGPKHE